MVIEFNTSRIPSGSPSQPTARPSAAPSATDQASFSGTDSINDQMSTLSTVRPDKVAAARDLVADGNYPSDNDLSRMAGLLATHLQSASATEAD